MVTLLDEHDRRRKGRAGPRRLELLRGPQELGHRQPHFLLHVRREFPRREPGVFTERSRRCRALVLFGAERLEDERRYDRERGKQDRQGRNASPRTAG